MAIAYASASSQFLSLGSAVLTAIPCTLACWFKPATFAANQTLVTIGASGSTAQILLSYRGDLASDPIRLTYANTTTSGTATTATGISAATWTHAAGVFTSATSRDVYINGGGAVNNATNVTAGGTLNRTRIGQAANSGAGNFMDGAIAYVGIWNIALSAAMIAQLATGADPRDIERSSLSAYLRCADTSDVNSIIDGTAWTLNATPTNSNDGPPVAAFVRRSYLWFPPLVNITGTGALAVTAAASGSGTETFTSTGAPAIVVAASGAGSNGFNGQGSLVVVPSLAATGLETFTATGAAALLPAFAGVGVETFTGVDGGPAFALTPTGVGVETFSATGAPAVTPAASGAGVEAFTGSGAPTILVSLAGVGIVPLPVSGSGAVVVGLTLAGVATETFAATGSGSVTVALSSTGVVHTIDYPAFVLISARPRFVVTLMAQKTVLDVGDLFIVTNKTTGAFINDVTGLAMDTEDLVITVDSPDGSGGTLESIYRFYSGNVLPANLPAATSPLDAATYQVSGAVLTEAKIARVSAGLYWFSAQVDYPPKYTVRYRGNKAALGAGETKVLVRNSGVTTP